MSSTYHGTQAKVAVKIDNTVAYTDADQTQSFTITQGSEVLDLYEMGNREPVELKAAKITVAGSIRRHWEAGNFSALGKTLQAAAKDATQFWIAIFPSGGASPKILLSNCKFSNWSLEGGVDGMLVESVSFKGLAVSIT